MGSSNPVKKIESATEDLIGSVENDPLGTILSTGGLSTVAGGPGSIAGSLGYQTGKRAVEDQRDQAMGKAQQEQDRARQAEATARDRAVKPIDPLALERRRRAQLASSTGRSSTILTQPGGTLLGASDVAAKTLLGL